MTQTSAARIRGAREQMRFILPMCIMLNCFSFVILLIQYYISVNISLTVLASFIVSLAATISVTCFLTIVAYQAESLIAGGTGVWSKFSGIFYLLSTGLFISSIIIVLTTILFMIPLPTNHIVFGYLFIICTLLICGILFTAMEIQDQHT